DGQMNGKVDFSLPLTAIASVQLAVYAAGCKAERLAPRRVRAIGGAGDDSLIDGVLAEIGETRSDATFRQASLQAGKILQDRQPGLYAGAIALVRARRLDEAEMLAA